MGKLQIPGRHPRTMESGFSITEGLGHLHLNSVLVAFTIGLVREIMD